MKNKKYQKVRMFQLDNPIFGKSYLIEVKKWYGWVQPEITYAEDSNFFDKKEADRWFDYLSGNTKNKKTLLKMSN